jgi:ankyrin repeat protein
MKKIITTLFALGMFPVYSMAPSQQEQAQDTKLKLEFEHAIAKEDIERIYALKKRAAQEDLENAFEYAAVNNKPRALAALTPDDLKSKFNQSKALRFVFEDALSQASLQELRTYYSALDYLKKIGQMRSKLYAKIPLETLKKLPKNQTESKLTQEFLHIPPEIHEHIQEFLSIDAPHQSSKMNAFLEEAIIKDSLMSIARALDHDMSINNQNNNGLNALELAVYHAKIDSLKLLILNSPHIDKKQHEKLISVAAQRLKDIQFLSDTAKRNELSQKLTSILDYLRSKDQDSLHKYTQEMNNALITNPHDTSITLKTLSHGADPNAQLDNGLPVLWLALVDNNPALTLILCKAGAEPNTPLHLPDGIRTTPLLYAIQHNQYNNVEILLSSGADVKARDSNGINPIVASLDKDPRYLRAILEHKANPNAKITSLQEKKSMITCALEKGALEHVQLLREYGARKKRVPIENKGSN